MFGHVSVIVYDSMHEALETTARLSEYLTVHRLYSIELTLNKTLNIILTQTLITITYRYMYGQATTAETFFKNRLQQ